MKSELSERASGALPGDYPGPIEMSPSLYKAELQKILDSFDVHGGYLEVQRVLNHLRGGSGKAMSSWPAKINNVRSGPQAPCMFP